MGDPGQAPRIVVFAGPTLARSSGPGREELLAGCEVRPPARRGDVLAAAAARPNVIVLLDGYYYSVPAVTHKEILYALEAGIRVVGAASLGALRAAELAPFGMTGVGTIYEWYRDGVLDGDDEVALLHAPAEYGYRPLTVALVEVRHAAGRLVAEGEAADEAATLLVAGLKDLPFLERRPDRVSGLARRFLGESAARRLDDLLASGSLKREDARRALAVAAAPARPPAPEPRVPTGYLSLYKEMHLRAPSGGGSAPLLLHAWQMAQLFHPEAAGFAREIRRRSLLAELAVRAGLAPRPGREGELVRESERCHERLAGRPFLPRPEYVEEARLCALAEAAGSLPGGPDEALRTLAHEYGFPSGREGTESLLRLASHPDAVPGWWLARAFSLTPALGPALAAASAAEEVHRCFRRWARGNRVVREDLWRLAAEIWGCEPAQVIVEAARRGLFPARGPSEGLREALERVAAAERLPEPVNDYREARERLAGVRLKGDARAWIAPPAHAGFAG